LLPAGRASRWPGRSAAGPILGAMIPRAPSDRRIRLSRRAGVVGIVALVALAAILAASSGTPVRGAERETRIAMSAPNTLDPARAGDAASAAVIAQLFEGLTAIARRLVPRPALAASWRSRMEIERSTSRFATD